MNITGVSPFSGNPAAVSIASGRITGNRTPSDRVEPQLFLSPGMVDLQVNGYRGVDYSMSNLSVEHVSSMVRYLAAAGTTQHLPTIITSPRDRILKNLQTIRLAREADPLNLAAIPGVHIEGPFISPDEGTRGVHDAAHIRLPDIEEFREWQEASGRLLSIVTVAPELKGAIRFIEEVSATGVVVGIGHTAAPPETVRLAVAAGARLSTHLGNGSATKVPRLRNFLWAQLALDGLHASIITDGDHLPAEVIKTISRAKGLERLVLISDVAPLGGFAQGVYKWGDIPVEVFEDGHLGLPGTTILAGAAQLLNCNVVHFARTAGCTLGDALRLCTVNAARLIGIEHPCIELAPGDPANVVLFRHFEESNSLEILRTVIGGETVFEAC